MAHEPVDNQQFESFAAAQGDARGDRVRAARPRGRAVDRRPAAHRHLGLRLRCAGVRLLLPALGEQRGPVAARAASPPPRPSAPPSSPSRWPAPCSVQFGERRFRDNETLDWQVAGLDSGRSAASSPSASRSGSSRELPFFPGSSGYASCFIAWAAMNIALLLGGTYWIETILAREIRLRRAMAQDGGAPTRPCPWPGCFGST